MTKSLHFWKGKYLSKKGTIRVINTYVLSQMFYDTETQTPTDDQIERIESEIKKVYWKNNQPNIRLDNLKMDYNEGGLNLTDINSKYGAQRVKWLLESKNLPQDTIENFLVDEGLGYYKDENITIKGFDLLKYRVPVDQIKNITPFYEESLIIWYSIDPIYNYKNNTDFQKDFIWYNPLLTNENGDTFEPIKSRGEILACKINTIYDTLNKPFTQCKRVVSNHVKKIKTSIEKQNPHQSLIDEDGYIFYKNQDIPNNATNITNNILKENDATAKEIYTIIRKNRLNPNKSWERKWAKVLQRNEKDLEWEKIWQTLHNSKVSYKIQSTLWSQINKSYLTNYSINKSNPQHPSICTYCNQTQTEQHHILYCTTAEKVWEHFKEILSKLSDKPFNLEEKIFGIIDAPKKSKEYLRNFITFTIRHVLINNRLYTLNDENLIALSNKTLREEIKYKYYRARCHGNLDNFKQNFF